MAVFEGRSLPRKSEKSVKIGRNRPINRPLNRASRTARRGDRKNVLGPEIAALRDMARSEADPLKSRALPLLGRFLPISTDFYRFLPIFRTFLGDFNPQKLPSGRLQTLWEWKNRVYSTLLYFTLLYSTLLYSTLLYSTLLYSTLLYSTLLYLTLLYSTLLYSTLLYSTLLYFTLLYFTFVDQATNQATGPGPQHQLSQTTTRDLLGDYQGIAGNYPTGSHNSALIRPLEELLH